MHQHALQKDISLCDLTNSKSYLCVVRGNELSVPEVDKEPSA